MPLGPRLCASVTPHNIASEMSSILSERRSVYVDVDLIIKYYQLYVIPSLSLSLSLSLLLPYALYSYYADLSTNVIFVLKIIVVLIFSLFVDTSFLLILFPICE